ncbi:MAG: CapA family protein, partial [Clostridia bacterium]|nr:CapA family protein [Clostridia bacterium]
PHVVHGIELWEGKPIAYSLGNFIFHAYGEGRSASARIAPPYRREYMRPPAAYQSYLLLLRIQQHRTTAVEVVPVQLDQAGEPAIARDTASEILARTARMGADLGTELQVNGNHAFVACGGWRPCS